MSQSSLPSNWRTCAADLFEHHDSVLERLERQNPSVDRDDLHDAFVTAILEIGANPEKFDSSRPTRIEDFLVGASQRALLQILRTHRRRKKREENKADSVADSRPAARLMVDSLAETEIAQAARDVAQTEEERKVLRLWELGHSDAEIAEQLGTPEEEATRHRDRLTQRLRRLRKQFDDQDP